MTRIFDFLERCKRFALDVFAFLEKIPMRGENIRISDQLTNILSSMIAKAEGKRS